MLRQFLVGLLTVGLLASPVTAGPTGKGGARAERSERQEVKRVKNLDDYIREVTAQTGDDGSVTTSTSYTEPIPFGEFIEMRNAIANDENPPEAPQSTPIDPLNCAVEAGDYDFDGDGFTGQDEFGQHRGPHIADPLRIAVTVEDLFVDIKWDISGSSDTGEETHHESSSTHEETTSFSRREESRQTIQGSRSMNVNFGFSALNPTLSFDFSESYNSTQFREKQVTRNFEETLSLQDTFSRIHSLKTRNLIEYTSESGRATGTVRMKSSGRFVTASITEVELQFIATDRLTGDRRILHTWNRTFLGSNPLLIAADSSGFLSIDEDTINTATVVEELALGSDFSVEATYMNVREQETGTPIALIDTEIASKTATIGIHYAGINGLKDEYSQVALDRGDGECPTVEDALRTIRQQGLIDFARLPDNSLVVRSVMNIDNVNADWDVLDVLQYNENNDPDMTWGRWVVGHDLGLVTAGISPFLDIEHTPLHGGDRIHLYYLTLADFEGLIEDPGTVTHHTLANDGSDDAEITLSDTVRNYEEIEISVKTVWLESELKSYYFGTVHTSGCVNPVESLYQAYRYYTDVGFDSTVDETVISSVDEYGFEIQDNMGQWLTMLDLVNDYGATIVEHNLAPDYEFTIRFMPGPSFTGRSDDELVDVSLRANAPRTASYLEGFKGRRITGQHRDCRQPEPSDDFTRHEVAVRTWNVDYDDDLDQSIDKIVSFDVDRNGVAEYTKNRGGIDHRDADAASFGGGPEVLDGIDNDGDNDVDDDPLICKPTRRPNEIGTCILDDRLDFYGPAPNVQIRSRTVNEDGSASAWSAPVLSDSITLTMPTDLEVDYLHLETTYFPSGGGSRTGYNKIFQIDPPDPDVFDAHALIQGEDGLLIHPMVVNLVGSNEVIGVPGAGVEGWAEYRVNAPVAGTYTIWANVYAEDTVDDQMVVDVFDPAGNLVDSVNFDFSDAYGLYEVGTLSGAFLTDSSTPGNPTPLVLPAGESKIVFRSDSPGPMLDAFVLTTYCPDVDGDGWGTCEGDCNDQAPHIHPGQSESCGTSYDDDCDGYINEGCGPSCSKLCIQG